MGADTRAFCRTQSRAGGAVVLPRPSPAEPGARFILVNDIADHLGIIGYTLQRKLKRTGYKTYKVPHPESGRPYVAVTTEDAKKIYHEERQKPQVMSMDELLKDEEETA